MEQLIHVYVGQRNRIQLKDLIDGDWQVVKEINKVYIGKAGATYNKIEGDMKTPLGTYKVGVAFGINDINIMHPYIQITDNSYWIDDPKSVYYNKWVELQSAVTSKFPYITSSESITWESAEHLIDYPIQYEMGFVIEYNIDNPVDENGKGNAKGSGIFFHIRDKEYTSGCIAVEKEDMQDIFEWLNYHRNPHIKIEFE